MTPFQCLLCNQYAEITKNGRDGRKAQLNTLMLLTVMFTLWVVIMMLLYDYIHPGFLRENVIVEGLSGKAIGRLLGCIVGVIIFICLKLTIGTKNWYNKTIEEYNSLPEEEQTRISKKGIRFFIIGFIPIMIGIVLAFTTVF